jgi:hypothetical protein
LTAHSDIAALMVFEHQARMINFITRLGWETRLDESGGQPHGAHIRAMAREFVDELLFAGEASLQGKIGRCRSWPVMPCTHECG